MSGRVADAIVDELLAGGVRRIYGMPGGGSNMTLIDAATARGLRFVLAHHETGAVFMAAAEAELTGIPGVCLATVGPGVANSINGLAHCSLDRVPLLLVSDRVEDPATLHQLVDHSRLVAAVAKSSEAVTAADARQQTRRALALALAAPRGPVHLDLAPEVAAAKADPPRASSTGVLTGAGGDIEAAADLLAAAGRPVALVGLGARDDETARALRRFVRAFAVPVLCTYKAKGVLPDADPLAFGLVTNGRQETALLDRADALLLVGFDRVELMPGPWRWQRPAVGVGEPASPGPFEATVALAGRAADALEALGDALDMRGWRGTWQDDPARPAPSRAAGRGISPDEVVAICRSIAPVDAIATVDAGSHMLAATLFWDAPEPRRFLISNGLATMGYGLPAAIGATLAQDAPVICFTGDGGLAMCAGELATAARLGVRLVIVVFNDGMLNLIKIKQERQGRTTHGLDFTAVDWATAATGMGLRTEAVATGEELAAAFVAALRDGGPTLLDVRVDASSYGELLTLVRG